MASSATLSNALERPTHAALNSRRRQLLRSLANVEFSSDLDTNTMRLEPTRMTADHTKVTNNGNAKRCTV